MSDLSQTGFEFALSRHTRSIEQDNWQVGAGATTTVIPVALANPSGVGVGLTVGVQQRIQGTVCEFISGQNQGQSAAVANCAANGTLTLDAALPVAPASGDRFILLRSVNVTVEAAENVAQWGGANVKPADVNGIPEVQQAYTEGVPGSPVPEHAILVGVTDGVDLRSWAGDAYGVAKIQGGYTEQTPGNSSPNRAVQIAGKDANGNTKVPMIGNDGALPNPSRQLVAQFSSFAASAGTNLMNAPYQPPANGKIRIRALIESGGAASLLSVIETPTTAPSSGGSSAASSGSLNNGADLTVGAWYEVEMSVLNQANYNFQFSVANNVSLVVTFVAE